MGLKCTKLLVIAAALFFQTDGHAKLFVVNRATDRIEGQCSSKIGAGGNLSNVAGDTIFAGKCEGAGLNPVTAQEGIKFRVDSSDLSERERDRTELAFTNKTFNFRETVYIGFRLMVPKEQRSTNSWFYMMQMWQTSPLGPIAGMRATPGAPHKINFMAKGTPDGNKAKTRATYDLAPGEWQDIVIRIVADPRPIEKGGIGKLTVWASGKKISHYDGAIGYEKSPIDGSAIRQGFRVKFGIYKAAEPGKKFWVYYDNVRMGSSCMIRPPFFGG